MSGKIRSPNSENIPSVGPFRREASRQRLTARRRRRRRLALAVLGAFFLLFVVAGIWGLNQNALRISDIKISAVSPPEGFITTISDEILIEEAKAELAGSYFGIIPRDSYFFFPISSIRKTLLSKHPEIAAISIFHNKLTGLSIKADYRVPIALWCGRSPLAEENENCFVFDARGFIFATATTTTKAVNNFSLYAPLTENTLVPLSATIVQSGKLPNIFSFARQTGTLGSSVSRIVIRADEVDEYLTNGTRITYLIGDEQNAFTALVSSKDNVNLSDGSVEYVDLRFGGKVYVKKNNE